MEIKDIMKRLDASRSEEGIKTASATSGNGTPTDPEALRGALRDALAAAPSEKTASAAPASATNPAGDLLKLAEDLTTAEEEAMMKQASIYGAAMCDGFMARFGQYEDAALQSPSVKTAQAAQPAQSQSAVQDADLAAIKTAAANDPEFQKFASENPDLVKEAADLGYRQTWDHLVKTAEADFESGYGDCMTEMHKLASECYQQGVLTINNVLRQVHQAA